MVNISLLYEADHNPLDLFNYTKTKIIDFFYFLAALSAIIEALVGFFVRIPNLIKYKILKELQMIFRFCQTILS